MELRKPSRKRPIVLGLILTLLALVLVQIGFLLPNWKQLFGFGSMLLCMLALLLGIYGLIRALISRQDRWFNGLLFILLCILAGQFGLWGFYLIIPS